MKKLAAVILAALMMCAFFAFAEEDYVGDMLVVNCEEWVSLRTEPSSASERIAKIPLNDIVVEAVYYDDAWVYCGFEGNYGYVSAAYLEPYESSYDPYDRISAQYGDITVNGYWDCNDAGESYHIEATDSNGNSVWQYSASCSYSTELQMTDAFFGGTEEKPLVMAFSAETGLEALDFFTGEALWKIENDTLSLGGSICYAVDENGDMYIGGYYGPDPVAISMDGEILWQSDFQGSYIWLYQIDIEGENLRCYYDMDDVEYVPVNVILAKNGNFVALEY